VRRAFIWFAPSIVYLQIQEKTSFADDLKCQKERKRLTKSLAFTEWAALTINRFVDRLVDQSIARLITIIEWTDSSARCNLFNRSSVYPSKFRAYSSEVPLLFFAGEPEKCGMNGVLLIVRKSSLPWASFIFGRWTIARVMDSAYDIQSRDANINIGVNLRFSRNIFPKNMWLPQRPFVFLIEKTYLQPRPVKGAAR
jgi:hypothetical protein